MEGGLAAMRRFADRFSLLRAPTLLLTWCLAANQGAYGSEFRFVVEDLPDNTAAWLPNEVDIHKETDLRGGLIFLLVNPTARTHVFFVEGLYEQIVSENGGVAAKPLRVTIPPEETARTVLSTAQFEGVREERKVEEFRFFCPLHRGDADPGGTIRIIHRGGTIRIVR